MSTLRCTVALLLLVLAGTSVAQLDTVKLQFRHISIKDGLSQGMVNQILQDRYGFMWFATKDGLNRYDGYSFRIHRHDAKDSSSVRNSYIDCILEDREGRIWVGTPTGLDVFDRTTETFHHIPCTDDPVHGRTPSKVSALPGSTVAYLAEDPQGSIWVSTPRGLSRIDPTGPLRDGVREWPITWAMDRDAWMALFIHKDGTLFSATREMPFTIDTRDPEARVRPITLDVPATVGTQGNRIDRTDLTMVHDSARNATYGIYTKGVMRIDVARSEATTLLERLDQTWMLSGTGAIVDASGRCWIPTQGAPFKRFDPSTGTLSTIRAEAPDLDPYLHYVKCMYRDRSGLIWLGLSGYGLLIYDPRVERFQLSPGPSIRYMMPGVNGRVVMNEGNFLSVYDPARRAHDLRLGIVEVRARVGFTDGFWGNDAVVQDRTGAFWASKGGLVRYDHEAQRMERVIPNVPDPRLPVNSSCFPLKLFNDTLWFGVDSGLFWFDPVSRHYDRLTPYPITPVNNPYPFLQALHRDANGNFWLGTVKGLFHFDLRTRSWTHYHNDPDDPNTLSVDVLFSLLPDPRDPEGVLWIGTNGGGLDRFEVATGKVARFTTKQGLPNDVVYGVLSDDSGQLWMSTNKGIARFDPTAGSFRNFTAADGLQNDEFNRYAYCKLANGLLCFGGVGGLNVFDPRTMEDDHRSATVILTDIKLRNRSIPFGHAGSPITSPPYESQGMEIPYSDNMVTFEFANVEYAAPLSHRYRYRLEGFDKDWITTVGDHAAVYTNLDPGTYTFHVTGANRDGYWGDAETTFRLVVLPPWWRTWWFYALCVIIVAGGALLYIGSLRRLVRLRTAQLLTEKERSEDLLNNILPVGVATELKEKGVSEAAYFEQVTILLTDFKDFTRIAERMDAALLVDELNTCFKAFDGIMEKYGIEKIKTIGDAYMAAGGLPDPQHGSPTDVIRAALEMQDFMMQHKAIHVSQGRPFFEMRVGIHTGPVVAGIVGAKKFQYDIWGDTVNTASRMESSGEVGKVNISEVTYALVKEVVEGANAPHATRQPATKHAFTFTPRGKVQSKGNGEMEMYFVEKRIN